MFSGGGGQILVQWPKQDQEWGMPSSGHIDGYGPNGWSGGFMLGATTYLYDVEPQGGAFIYWPKSHFSTHEYFREFPEQIDGSFNKIEDWGWHIFSDRSPEGPTQYIAKAGSVVFWHCFLCHTGSGNIRNIPRFGLFARWSYKEKEKMRYEIPEDLWKYWAI
jgi:ectoine hydroxylase-related dioxygenase (phytanoyl-CoA dioxygenase family)